SPFDADEPQRLLQKVIADKLCLTVDVAADFAPLLRRGARGTRGGTRFDVHLGFRLGAAGAESDASRVAQLEEKKVAGGPVGRSLERAHPALLVPQIVEAGDRQTTDLARR